jgi:hypothetical protein
MSSLTQDERKEYMDTLKSFMIEDLDKAIKAGLNYLAALGLSNYTEILGGLCYGNLLSNHKQNYDRFIKNYFPTSYRDRNKQLDKCGGLYGVVRSGLTHRYFIRLKSQVVTTTTTPIDCGIFYDPKHSPSTIFVLDKYFEDFKNAMDEYYKKLIIDRDSNLALNFDKAMTYHSEWC